MTKVVFSRTGVMNGVRIQGHQDGERKGEGIYCAAISAMGSTLVNGLRGEDLMAAPTVRVEDGLMLITCMRTPRTDAMYDMLERGFRALAAKEQGRVTVETARE